MKALWASRAELLSKRAILKSQPNGAFGVYALCDCESGYVCAFEPYFGKATTEALPWLQLPFATRIVMHLVDQVVARAGGTGYHVYTDWFYTSFALAMELHRKQIHLTGTVQANSKSLPKAVKSLKLRNDEMKVYRHPVNVLTLACQDKRLVLMLSTWHNGDMAPHWRWVKGRREAVEKPVVISDYTEHMGAVDRCDHYCSSYSFTRKTQKWWRKTFFWLLEVCLVNSFILYKKVKKQPASGHLTYRRKLIVQLVGGTGRSKSRKRGRLSTTGTAQRLTNKPHFLGKYPSGHNKRCMVCSGKDYRKTTLFYCKTRDRKPGLHPVGCFEKYHTGENYKGWNPDYQVTWLSSSPGDAKDWKKRTPLLFCCCVWSWSFCWQLCLSFLVQCRHVHITS